MVKAQFQVVVWTILIWAWINTRFPLSGMFRWKRWQLTPWLSFLEAWAHAITVNSWLPTASAGDDAELSQQVWVGTLQGKSESNSAPWWFIHSLYELQVGSAITRMANMRRNVMPTKQHHLCPAFVCRQSRAKKDVLSSTTNLWPYLLDKSIKVSESRAECAVGVLEGLPLGPSWGLPACLFTLHLFGSTASIL